MSRASALARGGCEARRLGSWRLSGRVAGDVAVGAIHQAEHHAVSQFPGDGDGGIAAQPSDRRRSADGRLRQDHAGADHGRNLDGHSIDLRARGPDAAWQLARPEARLRRRCLEILGRETRRQYHRRGLERDRGRDRALVRHLHGDGYGGNHDVDSRSDGARIAGRLIDPGRRIPVTRACARRSDDGSPTWSGKT